ncbi:unnamed protein product, partial [Symbiodinium necroappetens]
FRDCRREDGQESIKDKDKARTRKRDSGGKSCSSQGAEGCAGVKERWAKTKSNMAKPWRGLAENGVGWRWCEFWAALAGQLSASKSNRMFHSCVLVRQRQWACKSVQHMAYDVVGAACNCDEHGFRFATLAVMQVSSNTGPRMHRPTKHAAW